MSSVVGSTSIFDFLQSSFYTQSFMTSKATTSSPTPFALSAIFWSTAICYIFYGSNPVSYRFLCVYSDFTLIYLLPSIFHHMSWVTVSYSARTLGHFLFRRLYTTIAHFESFITLPAMFPSSRIKISPASFLSYNICCASSHDPIVRRFQYVTFLFDVQLLVEQHV